MAKPAEALQRIEQSLDGIPLENGLVHQLMLSQKAHVNQSSSVLLALRHEAAQNGSVPDPPGLPLWLIREDTFPGVLIPKVRWIVDVANLLYMRKTFKISAEPEASLVSLAEAHRWKPSDAKIRLNFQRAAHAAIEETQASALGWRDIAPRGVVMGGLAKHLSVHRQSWQKFNNGRG